MNANKIRDKYIGIQTKLMLSKDELSKMGDYGCLFLCLCSIAEEYNESTHSRFRVDIIADYLACRENGWIDDEFYVLDGTAVLKHLTGAEWTRSVVKSLPENIAGGTYTVERWHNPSTGFTHFRRRWGDTLAFSNTVLNGHLEAYYCYSCKKC